MKKLIFITLLLSFFVNAQIELRFNDFYINNYSKISYKKIQVTESNYTNFEALNKSKNEEKFWLKIEPRKLTKEEEIYNKDPNNLDVLFDFSTYLIRINIDCKNKFFRPLYNSPICLHKIKKMNLKLMQLRRTNLTLDVNKINKIKFGIFT